MNPAHPQPKIQLSKSGDYRETYANSVQVRVSVWDFFLNFGVAHQETPDQVTIENQLGVYVSPQQAKALWNMLGQNLSQYEQTFGAISLEPHEHPVPMPTGPIH
jgi:flagellar protein FlaG